MADITACNTKDCPMKDSCYRYTCVKNEFWQSYFTIPPYKVSENDVISCEHFWRNDEQ